MPALDLATSRAAGTAACIRVITGTISSGPLPQLPPTASTPRAVSASTACSGETPIIVWPRVSKVMVAMTGVSGAARRTPSMAAVISARSDIVSIHRTSAPPATRAAACSAKMSTASAGSSVPRGAMISPVGPMSPATSARPPAAVTSARSRMAAVRLMSATLSCRPCMPRRARLAPNVLVMRMREPASR